MFATLVPQTVNPASLPPDIPASGKCGRSKNKILETARGLESFFGVGSRESGQGF
jgi:hypothetical protein